MRRLGQPDARGCSGVRLTSRSISVRSGLSVQASALNCPSLPPECSGPATGRESPETAMPIYAFECAACGHSFDRLQKMSDPDVYADGGTNASELSRQRDALAVELARAEEQLLSLYETA